MAPGLRRQFIAAGFLQRRVVCSGTSVARQASLLGFVPAIQGLRFEEEFITPQEESALLERLRSLEFHEMKMRGVVAKRRVIHYGVNYSFETFKATPGAAIGWHRDAYPFDIVIGISLLSASRFRVRRGKVRAWETAEVPLPPRSIYVLTGPARTEWEHSIPPVKELRYSVTFRTLRRKEEGQG